MHFSIISPIGNAFRWGQMEEGSRKRLFVESALSGNSSALGSDFFFYYIAPRLRDKAYTDMQILIRDKCFASMYLIARARSKSNRDMQEI